MTNKKVKVINNIHSVVGFYLDPTPQSFRTLPRQGAFMTIDEDALDYIFINQEIIQKGILWIDDKDSRVKYGLETETGEKKNSNVLQYSEIVDLVNGNYKKLEKVINEIDEQSILLQFVEAAREVKLDSKSKIDIIEAKVEVKIFDEE